VGKDVITAIIRNDESKAFLHVEGLDGAHQLAWWGRRFARRRSALLRCTAESWHAAKRAKTTKACAPEATSNTATAATAATAAWACRRSGRIGVCTSHLHGTGLAFCGVIVGLITHTCTLAQRVAILQRVAVGKDVITAIIRNDEPKALLHVEVLDGTHHLAWWGRRFTRGWPALRHPEAS